MQTTAAEQIKQTGNLHDEEHQGFLARVQERLLGRLAVNGEQLFTTDAHGLWDAYLDQFNPSERQYHNCNACRRFVEAYGGLVVITADGMAVPAVWMAADAEPSDHGAIAALERIVARAKVTGPFLSSQRVLGTPVTGIWRHVSVELPASMLYSGALLTASQAMAEKREDFKNVRRALDEFKPATVEQALALLKSEQLYRAEKVIGPAEFLHGLYVALKDSRPCAMGRRYDRGVNLIWKAVAAAPAGFCHPRSSMIGSLLEDIESGMDFATVQKRFAQKMNPGQYQRPQAPPSAGNIEQAEKIVEKLGIANSLRRRFARLDEVETIWSPKATEPAAPAGGVFGHLKPKAEELPEMKVPPTTITWEKFARTVLPEAVGIELAVPSGHSNFFAMLTAADPDAPPIIQWDSPEQRNPFSVYVYISGSTASRWGLVAGQWCDVTAITRDPAHWFGREASHHDARALLMLKGAKDHNHRETSNGLFPEILRGELHGIRSTIEAFSKKAEIEGFEEASACGLCIGGKSAGAHVRVTTTATQRLEYRIDRWD